MDHAAVQEPSYLQTDLDIDATARVTPHEIWEGLAESQFLPYFQPKVATAGKHLLGVEALLRWRHPQRGILSARAFLSMVEDRFLLEDLTKLVLEKAIRQCRRWREQGLEVPVAVNVPVGKLREPEFADWLAGHVRAFGLDPWQLVIEVPESAVALGASETAENLVQLRRCDFGLAIDDYGTGRCSRAQLERIPASELKLDRSLFARAVGRSEARKRLQASVEMARELNFRSVAEGIENQEEWDLAADLGCDAAQGYFIARPMSGEAIVQWHELWASNSFM